MVRLRQGTPQGQYPLMQGVALARSASQGVFVLRQKIQRPRFEGIKRRLCTFEGQGGKHQNGSWPHPHDLAHGMDSIHHRHGIVHGDQVRTQRQSFFNRLTPIFSRADHFNAGVLSE